jgi:transposase
MTHSSTAGAGERCCSSVTGGVDTHSDTHTAAVLDATGRLLGHRQFPATPAGYQQLLAWLRGHGEPDKIGVEGTGAYGAGLARYLQSAGVELVEVDRPDRKARRRQGKSDPVDAEAAARAAQAGRAIGVPKDRDGAVEALRALRIARRSAVAARAQAQTQMKSMIVTAPEPLRGQLRKLGVRELVAHCAARRPDRAAVADPATATVVALRALARRHQQLTAEITELDALIAPLVTALNPALCALPGVGPDVAGQLLVTAGDNPHRLRCEAAFAMLCGAAPLPASSGRTDRHRLNRGGDRHANAALYRIALCRLRWDPRARDYAARRTAAGLSRPEIIRCLKRYIAREVYTALLNPHGSAADPSSTTDPGSAPSLPPSRPSLAPRRRSQRGAPAAKRGRTTLTPTSGVRRSQPEEGTTQPHQSTQRSSPRA